MNQPENSQPDRQRLLDSMQAHLSSARRSGIRIVGLSQSAGRATAAAAPAARETLDSVRADLGACTRCGLCGSRTSLVFGQGSQRARLVFVGGAPLAADDAAGEPFSGPEGEMLTNIITRVLNLTRPDVYLTTLVKCATPEGRAPAQDEITACLPFLRRQLAAIEPSIVCALGQVAAQALLGSDRSLDELRGRFHRAGGLLIMPTHDPAFLRVHEHRKRETRDDMLMIVRELSKKASPF
ncbi:MAG: uracil-DNA glycosylase [Deltaproteobacteria bacterium]|nr:uracil-DNA glycosylase [Deltaproteobacteria bacterium]